MIVFLLLGVIWAAVLLPPWLQSRREAQPTASIRSFHRQLWLLGRTSPARGTSRPRTRAGRGAGVRTVGGSGLVYGTAYEDYSGHGAYAGYGDYGAYGDDYSDEPYAGYGDVDVDEVDAGPPGGADRRWVELAEARRRTAGRSPAELRRRTRGYQRRRQVLATLAAAALLTTVPALLVGGTTWWAVQGGADVLLVAYVALLVERQRRSMEREEKVHYLAPIRAPRPSVVVLHGGAAR